MVARIHTMQRRSNDPGGLSALQIVRLEKKFKRVANSTSGTVLSKDIEAILSDKGTGLGEDVPRRAIQELEEVRTTISPNNTCAVYMRKLTETSVCLATDGASQLHTGRVFVVGRRSGASDHRGNVARAIHTVACACTHNHIVTICTCTHVLVYSSSYTNTLTHQGVTESYEA